jgi:hypothetical protein
LIFSLGTWYEVSRDDICSDSGLPALLEALDYLKQFAQEHRNIHIIWKTHGGADKRKRAITRDIRRATRQWFANNTSYLESVNMELVEFGTQVLPRTYGEKRIVGDSMHHLGPEARLLSLQMITHGIVKQICSDA